MDNLMGLHFSLGLNKLKINYYVELNSLEAESSLNIGCVKKNQ